MKDWAAFAIATSNGLFIVCTAIWSGLLCDDQKCCTAKSSLRHLASGHTKSHKHIFGSESYKEPTDGYEEVAQCHVRHHLFDPRATPHELTTLTVFSKLVTAGEADLEVQVCIWISNTQTATEPGCIDPIRDCVPTTWFRPANILLGGSALRWEELHLDRCLSQSAKSCPYRPRAGMKKWGGWKEGA
jgi:hypothetical protein